MTFKSNVSELKSYVSRAPEAKISKIRDVIKLYEDKKIVNFRTALNATLLLSSTNKNTLKSGRAEKEYGKIISKYSTAKPMTGRLKESYKESKETIKKKNFKEYLLDVILYVKNPKSDEPGLDDTEQVRREKKRAKAYGVRYHDALKQVWIGQVNVNIAEMFSDRLVYDQEENGGNQFWEIIRNYGSLEKILDTIITGF